MTRTRTVVGRRCMGMTAVAAALMLALPPAVRGQSAAPTVIPRIDGPLHLDGRVEEEEWAAVPVLDLTQYRPRYRAPLSEHTELRVAHDGENLLVSGVMHASDPATIRSNSLYRDRDRGDDLLAVLVDTNGDHESGLWFAVTPAGVRLDRLVTGDAAGTGNVNDDWNAFWQADAVRLADGWSAELRIPFSSLGLRLEGSRVAMGLMAYRLIAQRDELQLFPDVPPDWESGYLKPSQARSVELRGVEPGRPLYLTPYIVAGVGETAEPVARGFEMRSRTERDIGGDLRYVLGGRGTVDITVNTDFAQVEADAQQINLDRFPLFFPEKRRFFQERSELFRFGTSVTVGNDDRLFHSRRIGLDGGRPVPIVAGARWVGGLGAWEGGAMAVQTASDDDVPAETFAVAGLRRQLLNERSLAAGVLTLRAGGGSYHAGLGLRSSLNPSGDNYLHLRFATTVDDATTPGDWDPLRSSFIQLEWERRRQQGFNYQVRLSRSGGEYRPELGFQLRSDFTELQTNAAYGIFPERSAIRVLSSGAFVGTFLRNGERDRPGAPGAGADARQLAGTVESAFVQPFVSVELRSGASIFFAPGFRFEDVLEPFQLPGAVRIRPGRHRMLGVSGSFTLPPGELFRGSVSANYTPQWWADGWTARISVRPEWMLSSHLSLGASYDLRRAGFPAGGGFTTHLARLRAETGLNRHLSANAVIQYNSDADRVTPSLRLRYNMREGNDLWLVFDNTLNVDRATTPPRPPRTERWLLLLKYTHTLGG